MVRDGVADLLPDHVEPVANHLLQEAFLARLALDLAAFKNNPNTAVLADILAVAFAIGGRMGLSEQRLDEIRIARAQTFGSFSRFRYKGADVEKPETRGAAQGLDEALVKASKGS
jgi:predicted house-cleaning noncanonical NTP pyrophosphatase (MazG superfamily)